MKGLNRINFDLSRLKVDAAEEVCPLCLGAGVVVEEGDDGRRARPCDCRREKEKARRLSTAGVPPRYRLCRLEGFKTVRGLTDEASAQAALATARAFAAAYPAVDAGLLFMGPVGVGKTHLAVGILNELAERKGAICRFCDFADLLANIRRRYAADNFDEYTLVDRLATVEVLLLDDLGSMKIRDWTLDLLSYVINQRYEHKRLIIATTNFLDPEVKSASGGARSYGPTEGMDNYYLPEPARRDETLGERIGDRLRSRLYEMCKTVLIRGADFRQSQRQSGLLTNL